MANIQYTGCKPNSFWGATLFNIFSTLSSTFSGGNIPNVFADPGCNLQGVIVETSDRTTTWAVEITLAMVFVAFIVLGFVLKVLNQ